MIPALLAAAVAPLPIGRPVAEAERAFAAAARAEGQWAAFRRFMAPDAIMLAPDIVRAADFLPNRKEPAAAVTWAPARTVTACDGSLAFSTGPWVAPDGKTGGRFFTIWRKETDGAWRWIYDGGTSGPVAGAMPPLSADDTASCKAMARTGGDRGGRADGWSKDGTLRWRLDPGPIGKTYLLRVFYSEGGAAKLATRVIVGG